MSEQSPLALQVEQIVDSLDACTQDLRDCEVMRAAIILQDAEADNEKARAIRVALCKVACEDCLATYLSDIKQQNSSRTG